MLAFIICGHCGMYYFYNILVVTNFVRIFVMNDGRDKIKYLYLLLKCYKYIIDMRLISFELFMFSHKIFFSIELNMQICFFQKSIKGSDRTWFLYSFDKTW